MNQAWNYFKIDDGMENYPFYTKLLLTNPLLIFLTLSPGIIQLIQLEGQTIFPCQALNNFFQNSYFPSAIKEWNRLDIDLQKSDSNIVFKKRILSSIKLLPNNVLNSHNPRGLKLLTKLQLGLSHLRYHEFKHIFLDTINSLCSCGSDIETTLHFFLYCLNFTEVRSTLLSKFLKLIMM